MTERVGKAGKLYNISTSTFFGKQGVLKEMKTEFIKQL